MRPLLIIIVAVFGWLAMPQPVTGAAGPAQKADAGHHKSNGVISELPQPISVAEHVQLARVLTATPQRRDHRALDDCFLPPQAILLYSCPAHTPITDKQIPATGQQRLLLLFPQHYFW